ncbi:hypothetical protein AGMMS49587_04020 [Spirochaetia bacterium]|nr:hypothetical protein AGMMS49587_04020 [Spirochaetia bacterium]
MKRNKFFAQAALQAAPARRAAGVLAAVLIFGLALAGCKDGSGDGTGPTYELVDSANPDIKVKFGVSTASDAFASLHELISTPKPGDDFTLIIALGDYIDLPALTIGGTTIDDRALGTPGTASYHDRLLRLIVVGINSFQRDGGLANNPGAPGHVVFQFRNVPVTHNMEATDINTNGYAGSAMKAYLRDEFLPDLKNAAGLTDAMLWAPTRKVSKGGYGPELGVDDVRDTLWLPTVWEIYNAQGASSAAYETSANQARLEYYTDNPSHRKYDTANIARSYWLASPSSGSAAEFAGVNVIGNSSYSIASVVSGCAPAFCVK